MNIQNILNICEIVVAVLMIGSILLQQKGSGLGSSFGGSDAIYSTKRGAEKFIFISSIVLSVLFLGLALASFLMQK